MINSIYEDSQRTLTGELLCNPDDILIEMMLSNIKPQDFSILECRNIYEACIDLYSKGSKIDALSVLKEMGGGDGIKFYMLELTNSVISTVSFQHHIQILKDCSTIETAKKECTELYNMLNESPDVNECRDAATTLLGVFDDNNFLDVVSSATGFRQFVESALKPRRYIKTGIKKIDDTVKISKSDFIICGGRPSSGKTALSLQLGLYMAKEYKVVYFSLETSVSKLFDRIISCYSGFSFPKIQAGGLKEPDIEQIKGNSIGLDDLNFSVINGAGMDVQQIISKSICLRADIIFIDYLGLIKGDGKSIYERVTKISTDLHQLAQRHGITIIALSQLNRQSADTQPSMTSLRESGQIEQDADAILLLDTPDDTEGERHIKRLTVAKNKTGEVCVMNLNFNGEKQIFTAISEQY